jgi:hypothetical protein
VADAFGKKVELLRHPGVERDRQTEGGERVEPVVPADDRLGDDERRSRVRLALHLCELRVLRLVRIEGDAAGEPAGVFAVDVADELDRGHGRAVEADLGRFEPVEALAAVAGDDEQVPAAGRLERVQDRVELLLRVERVEVDHQLFGKDGEAQELDRLHGPVAQEAHGIVGDADDPARRDDLPVLVLEGLEVLLDVLGAALGRLELDVEDLVRHRIP